MVIRKKQDQTIQKLRDDLIRLCLTPHWIRFNGKTYPGFTTLLNSLANKKKDRTDFVKARERQGWIARNIYSKWLDQKLVGQYIYADR